MERQQLKGQNQVIDDPSSVEDELLSQLEKEEIPSHIREARLQTLKQQSSHFQQLRDLSFGQYTLIPDEKSFLDLTTSSLVAQCVVHFFHPDFRRCAIVDKHFEHDKIWSKCTWIPLVFPELKPSSGSRYSSNIVNNLSGPAWELRGDWATVLSGVWAKV
ncbi:CCT complex interacting protein [Bulinus truncatus]|nr:CCT complex interacting protein [Bulinus truncatus]